jgi:hypothetical protein
MCDNNADVSDRRTGPHYDIEVHGNKVFAQNLKSSGLCERILCSTDTTLDGIFDGNHRRHCSTVNNRRQCLTDIAHGEPVGTSGLGNLSQGSPREGADGS